MMPDHLIKCAQSNIKGERIKMTIFNYVQYMHTNNDSKPLYVFDSGFHERIPELREGYEIPLYLNKDWFSLLSHRRPAHRWFLMGPPRSGTNFHIDPNGTSAWNALVVGSKRWVLYPPDFLPPGVFYRYGKNGMMKGFKAPTPLKWFYEVYPFLAPHQRPIEFIQNAGEMIYIPAGWWHMVINLSETVSVTQNFVNDQNLELTTRWLYNQGHHDMLAYWMDRLKEVSGPHWKRVWNKLQIIKGKSVELKFEKLTIQYQKEKTEWKDKEQVYVQQIQNLTLQLEECKRQQLKVIDS